MQSYDGFPLHPRNIADSFSSCVDKTPHHGQIRQNPPKLVQFDTNSRSPMIQKKLPPKREYRFYPSAIMALL